MLLLKGKILAAVIVLMVFVGQAPAMNIAACQMNDGQQSANLNEVSINITTAIHSSAIISERNAGPLLDGSDCCDQNCDCSSGNCAATMLSAVSYNSREGIFLQKNNRYQPLIPDQSHISPYRPPIHL